MAKKKKAKKTALLLTPRNPFATDPLMKKGGAHEKTFKSKRNKQKTQLRKQLAEYSLNSKLTIFVISLLSAR